MARRGLLAPRGEPRSGAGTKIWRGAGSRGVPNDVCALKCLRGVRCRVTGGECAEPVVLPAVELGGSGTRDHARDRRTSAAADFNPARYVGAADLVVGTVAAGRVADLVLVDATPLADVRNTRRVRAVVLDGRYLDRLALDSLLAGVRRAANPRPQPAP